MKITKSRVALLLILLIAVFLLVTKTVMNSRSQKIKPRVGPIVEAVYALGTVKTDRVFNLKTGIPSSVAAVYVVEGQEVVRGAPLVRLDSKQVFAAPFSGTVTRVFIKEGELSLTGTVILTLMDLRQTYVQVSLDQNSALRVKKTQKVQLSVETIRGQKLTGTVESIYPSDGQFISRIRVPSIPPEVLPEMTADVAIEVARREKALLIPLKAVKDGSVHILRDGKKKTVKVNVGAIDGAWAEVLDGSIEPGDEILLGGKS